MKTLNTLFKSVMAGLICTVTTGLTHAQSMALLLDVSSSTELMRNAAVLQRNLPIIEREIKSLKAEKGSMLTIKAFGDNGASLAQAKYLVAHRVGPGAATPDVLAQKAKHFLIKHQRAKASGSTSIVNAIARSANFCKRSKGIVVILSDGIESSGKVNFHKSASQQLPLRNVSLKNCDVLFIGLGSGLDNPQHEEDVKKQWDKWFKLTKAKSVDYMQW